MSALLMRAPGRSTLEASSHSGATLRAAVAVVVVVVAGCTVPEIERLDVDDLGATIDDPVLLTVAAARARAGHVIDEGATFAADDGFAFATDTSGDLVLGFVVDGVPVLRADQLAGPVRVVSTSSDALLLSLPVRDDLEAELRFAAASGRVSILDVVLRNSGDYGLAVDVVVGLRRCDPRVPGSAPVPEIDRRFFGVQAAGSGVSVRFRTPVDTKLAVIGDGTYAEDFEGSFDVDGAAGFAALAGCASGADVDVAALPAALEAGIGDDDDYGVVGTAVRLQVPRGGALALGVKRAVAAPGLDLEPARRDGIRADDVDADLPAFPAILAQGLARLAKVAPFPTGAPRGSLSEEQARLVFRSSFVLLDQLALPAAGDLDRDTFVFSREPSFWFGRIGQHAHEGLVLPMWARLDPAFAVGAVMNFVDRVEDDGYLPYNIGPIVTQAQLRTSSAPLLCDVGRRTLDVAAAGGLVIDDERARLRDACALTLGFFRRERDDDGDGLLSWGGFAVSESLRDLHNPVWIEVADPELLETVDPNAMIVVEERALALLLEQTGAAGAEATRARADADVVRLQQLFDDERGFYFHRDSVDDDRDVDGASLFRFDIGGLLPLWADAAPPNARRALLGHLGDPEKFGRPFGIPGIAADDVSYDPAPSDCCKWDGPVWVPWNGLVVRGLLASGDVDERAAAVTLIDATVDAVAAQLVRHHQFRETYHPDDDDAVNDSMPNYIWSALVAEMMIEGSQ
ncbi:MAG: hypothetical protein Q8O67_19230 [Deltaproteobacteria bacterium]|nr:hypothetical protein [Deltaproteobacteria bacterium]